MRKVGKYILAFSIVIIWIVIFNYLGWGNFAVFNGENNESAVFLVQSSSPDKMRGKFKVAEKGGEKIKVLIVPGHEPDFGGAEYGAIKERELNLQVAENIKKLLTDEGEYDVTLTRNSDGWNKELLEYFNTKMDDVVSWKNNQRLEMAQMVNEKKISRMDNPYHMVARSDVANRLYAINKWATEKGFDLIIHIHFNDDPARWKNGTGKYTGFSIYVPERQYSNSNTSQSIASFLFLRFSRYGSVSDLPQETSGVVEDQDLIAIGSYNTLDAPSVLLEYGYIYEAQLNNPETRKAFLNEYAHQTFWGIENFFGSSNSYPDTTFLPYKWEGDTDSLDIVALQISLMRLGYYPPSGKTRNDCPVTGKIGPCTKEALINFQKEKGIKGASGEFGPLTKKELNILFSGESF